VSGIRILKSIGKQFLVQGGIEVCRGYMRQRLRLVKPKDLYEAIIKGTHTLSVTEQEDRTFGKKWARIIERMNLQGKQIRRDMLTAENVLEWLRVDRPDLASLIVNMNPEGMEWLREDVNQIYNFLFSEPKPKQTALTLVKRTPPKQETPQQNKYELEQGAEDAGVHTPIPEESSEPTATEQKTTETAEKA